MYVDLNGIEVNSEVQIQNKELYESMSESNCPPDEAEQFNLDNTENFENSELMQEINVSDIKMEEEEKSSLTPPPTAGPSSKLNNIICPTIILLQLNVIITPFGRQSK